MDGKTETKRWWGGKGSKVTENNKRQDVQCIQPKSFTPQRNMAYKLRRKRILKKLGSR